MSKKQVDKALKSLQEGDLKAVTLIIKSLEGSYLKKRLSHLITSHSDSWASARQLWLHVFIEPPPIPEKNEESIDQVSIDSSGAKQCAVEKDDEILCIESPKKITIEDPNSVICWLSECENKTVDLGTIEMAHIWGLVGLATLARCEMSNRIKVVVNGSSKASRFAHAVGLHDAINNKTSLFEGESGRTLKLQRFNEFTKIESTASEISTILFPDREDESVRKTTQYVIVELLRNVLQHSQDKLGGVVAAQLMSVGTLYSEIPCVQVAVADSGIGIHQALLNKHPDLVEAKLALEKALWPHISGTFEEGLTGSGQNAGMGLFFISEMTKLTGGKLLISSKKETIFLEADPKDPDKHTLRLLNSICPNAFPGTLVVFEIPLGGVADYDSLIDVIRKRAIERTPQRAKHSWIRYDRTPPQAKKFLVRMTSEDTVAAEKFAQNNLIPLIMKKEAIVLDFGEVEIATQSYLHALLFETLRIAWALRTHVYVTNATPSVRSGLDLLQNYALGG